MWTSCLIIHCACTLYIYRSLLLLFYPQLYITRFFPLLFLHFSFPQFPYLVNHYEVITNIEQAYTHTCTPTSTKYIILFLIQVFQTVQDCLSFFDVHGLEELPLPISEDDDSYRLPRVQHTDPIVSTLVCMGNICGMCTHHFVRVCTIELVCVMASTCTWACAHVYYIIL